MNDFRFALWFQDQFVVIKTRFDFAIDTAIPETKIMDTVSLIQEFTAIHHLNLNRRLFADPTSRLFHHYWRKRRLRRRNKYYPLVPPKAGFGINSKIRFQRRRSSPGQRIGKKRVSSSFSSSNLFLRTASLPFPLLHQILHPLFCQNQLRFRGIDADA